MNKLRHVLQEKKIDFALFCSLDSEAYNKNIYYFTGYKGIGCLVMPKKKRPFLIVPLMEYEKAVKTSNTDAYVWEKGERLFAALGRILNKKRIAGRKIGVVYSDITLNDYKSLKKRIKKSMLKDISKECFELRKIKTEKEIKLVRKSCSIACKIICKCIKNFHMFRTEKDVWLFLHKETINHDCLVAFPPIVASGKAGSIPHYEPKNIRLRKGFCVIDFGVTYLGYNSDITRTIYLGAPSKKEKEVYNLLLKAQQAVISKLKPGKKCGEAYEDALLSLGEYAENFTHGLGHGLGLNIHELPNLKPVSEEILMNNMVFTIEPGIYFRNRFGIRIEDDILIKNNKAVILTKAQRKLIIIKR